jgi:hypothetical protein
MEKPSPAAGLFHAPEFLECVSKTGFERAWPPQAADLKGHGCSRALEFLHFNKPKGG